MTMMTMKKAMVAAAGLVIAATAMADASFDELLALSRTPANQVTAANAQAIYDASVAVTNKGKINFLVDKKFISAEVAYAKAIELSWLDSAIYIANSASNTAWHAEVASKAADKIIAAAVGDLHLTSYYQVMKNAMLDNGKYLLLTDTTSTLAIADKLIAAEKWVAASVVLFSYQAKACQEKRIEAVNAKYLDTIYAKLASGEAGEFWNKFAYFDMLVTCYYTKDYDKLNNFPVPVLEKLFGDVRDYEVLAWNWITSTTRPFSDQARAAALKSANISDKKRIAIASVADKVLGNKTSSTSIFEKITDKALKLQLALYLNDKDKIIDVFGSLDNSVDAKTLDESLTVINALDIDYRAADVLKALRNANAKYTLKLYDDRDTWEPILSKMRAMIETR